MTVTFRETLEFALVLNDLGKVTGGLELFDYIKAQSTYQDIYDTWRAYGKPTKASGMLWGHFRFGVSRLPAENMPLKFTGSTV